MCSKLIYALVAVLAPVAPRSTLPAEGVKVQMSLDQIKPIPGSQYWQYVASKDGLVSSKDDLN
jgi:hypothetical protein